ncbi:MAG: transcription antitermination protein NusB [Flavobacteriales bacterium]|nr:transcription antitermination protein NusB [Flavobacteriales bacterium]
MLNRRQLRIKVLQILYAFYQSEDRDLPAFEKQLLFSIDKAYEMYIYLLLLIVDMQRHAIEKIEAGLQKRLPSKEDLHPNTKFVTNAPLRALANSKILAKTAEQMSISMVDEPDLTKNIFRHLVETEEYKEYMASEERGFAHDRLYLLKFFKKHLINEESLHDYFEEKSIYWNDDLDIIASMTIKTVKLIEEDSKDITLLPLWRDEKDEKGFLLNLFRNTAMKGEEFGKLIDENAANWDTDRIALMDMILMKMAIAEATTMQSVPIKVTLNEYIELSKYYSTPKSNGFINGLLDQVFSKMQDDKSIKKVGRGLVE